MLLLRKSSTMCMSPQCLIPEYLLLLLAIRQPVKRLQLIAWKEESLKFHWLTCRTRVVAMPGERSRSKSKKWRAQTATLTSTEWTSQRTNSASLSRNGTTSLKPLFKPRPPMDTCSESSLLVSQREQGSKWRLPAMPRALKRRLSAKRWWKLWWMSARSLPSRILPKNSFKSQLENKSLKNVPRFSQSKMFWSERSSLLRSPSSISPNSWSCIRRDQKLRGRKKLKIKTRRKMMSQRTNLQQKKEWEISFV